METEFKNIVMFSCKKDTRDNKLQTPRDKALDLEKKILATQGLIEGENVWISDVPIKGQLSEKEEQYIHTIEVGRENQEKLLFIHGYGGTGVYMWKIMAQLAQHFHVYAIDQYGQGLSSRPEFKLKRSQYDETVDFFCNAIEDWRKEVGLGEEKPFSLMGHSFGGYTAVQYVKTKQPNLKHLYLLSPAGMTHQDDKILEGQLKENFKMGWAKRKFVKAVFWLIQDRQWTPFQLMNLKGKEKSIAQYYQAKRLTLSEKESDLFGKFYYQVAEQNVSSDKALGTFLNYARYSKQPGIPILSQLQKENKLPPTTMWYGDKDWMDDKHTLERIQEVGLQNHIKFEIIEKSGHQIVFNQPLEIAKKITEDYKFTWKPVIPKDYVQEKTLDIVFNE